MSAQRNATPRFCSRLLPTRGGPAKRLVLIMSPTTSEEGPPEEASYGVTPSGRYRIKKLLKPIELDAPSADQTPPRQKSTPKDSPSTFEEARRKTTRRPFGDAGDRKAVPATTTICARAQALRAIAAIEERLHKEEAVRARLVKEKDAREKEAAAALLEAQEDAARMRIGERARAWRAAIVAQRSAVVVRIDDAARPGAAGKLQAERARVQPLRLW